MKRSMLICWTVLVCLLSFLPALRAQEPRPLVAEPEAPRVNLSASSGVSLSRLMKFSGLLKNRDGSARSGVQGLTFALYREEREGPPLWMETVNVEVDGEGRYTALLGSTKPEGLPLELFASGEARWLGVQGQLPGDEEQRLLLVSVPYALKALDAETLGGRPVSAFVLAEQLNEMVEKAQSSKGGVGVMTAAGGPQGERPEVVYITSGTAGRIAKFTSGTDLGDSVMFESGGRIGVGTTAPISTLHVQTAAASDYITLSAYQIDLFDKGFLVRSAKGTSGAPTAVANGNILFNLYAQGHDGTDYGVSGGITMAVDGSVSTGIVPGAILFQTANSAGTFAERMRINSVGNVGVGTINPAARLEVVGAQPAPSAGDGVAATSVLQVTAGKGGNTTGFSGQVAGAGAGVQIEAGAGGDAPAGGVKGQGGNITLKPGAPGGGAGSGGAHGNVLLAPAGGNVGIGLGPASPTQKLEVAGNVKLTGVGSGVMFPDGSSQTTRGLSQTDGDSRYALLFGNNSYTGSQTITGTQTLSGDLSVGGSISSLRPALEAEVQALAVEPTLQVNTTARRVGIGTSSPSATLTVNTNVGSLTPSIPAVVLGNSFGSTAIYQGSDSPNNYVELAWNHAAQHGRLLVGGGKPLALQDSGGGRVGIGTTTPGAFLHVTGAPPGAVSTGPGTHATSALQVTGAKGGDTSQAGAVGGDGGGVAITGGTGGAATGTGGTGGKGGSITLEPGAGGTGATPGSAGNVVVAGNLKLLGTGNGITFPDGSTQTTAGGAGGLNDVTGTAPVAVTSPTPSTRNLALNPITDANIAVGANITASKVDAGSIQRRVAGTCTTGQAMRVISQDGTVTCEAVSGDTTFNDGRYVNVTGDTMSGALTLPSLTASSATAGSPITATNSSGTGANFGVYAQNDSTSGDGVRGFARAATGPAWGVVGISNSASGIGVNAIATAAATTNFGVIGQAGAESARTFFTQSGVWGDSAAGTGVLATSETNRALVATNNTSVQTVEIKNYTTGSGFLLAAFDAAGTARFWVNNAGSTFATGTKSAMVTLSDGRQVALYAIESPESWFEDFGSGTLNNGRAQITIDPTFVQTVNTEVGYHVYLTANGDCRGLYVAQKGPGFFEVRELGGGQSAVNFDYRIVARRKGHEQARLPQLNLGPEIPRPASEQQPDSPVGRSKEGSAGQRLGVGVR